MNSKLSSQSGFVLIVVISMIAILLVLGLGFGGYLFYGLERTAFLRDSSQAYYAACSGIERATQDIQSSGKSSGTMTYILTPLGESSISLIRIESTVEWKPAEITSIGSISGDAIEITSRGWVKTKTGIKGFRMIKAIISPSSPGGKILYAAEVNPSEEKTK